jgi:hypothetical protein
MSSCCHTNVLFSKSKDEYYLMVSSWIGLTFHMCKANSNDGAPPRAIIGPSGVHMVALVNSSPEPFGFFNGDDARRLL